MAKYDVDDRCYREPREKWRRWGGGGCYSPSRIKHSRNRCKKSVPCRYFTRFTLFTVQYSQQNFNLALVQFMKRMLDWFAQHGLATAVSDIPDRYCNMVLSLRLHTCAVLTDLSIRGTMPSPTRPLPTQENEQAYPSESTNTGPAAQSRQTTACCPW